MGSYNESAADLDSLNVDVPEYEYVQNTAPGSPSIGEEWLDTSTDPPEAKVYADLGGGGKWTTTGGIDGSTTASIVSRMNGTLQTAFGRLFFDRGMDELGFSDGYYELLNDVSNLTGDGMSLAGDGTTSPTGGSGTLTRDFYDAGFVPSRVVITHNATDKETPIGANGGSFSYDIADTGGVNDFSLVVRGEDSTGEFTPTFSNVDVGQSESYTVRGNAPADIDFTLTPDGGDGGQIFAQAVSDPRGVVTTEVGDYLAVGDSPDIEVLDANDGSVVQSESLTGFPVARAGADGTFYFEASTDGRLVKLDSSGNTWTEDMEGSIGAVAASTGLSEQYVAIALEDNSSNSLRIYRDDGGSFTFIGSSDTADDANFVYWLEGYNNFVYKTTSSIRTISYDGSNDSSSTGSGSAQLFVGAGGDHFIVLKYADTVMVYFGNGAKDWEHQFSNTVEYPFPVGYGDVVYTQNQTVIRESQYQNEDWSTNVSYNPSAAFIEPQNNYYYHYSDDFPIQVDVFDLSTGENVASYSPSNSITYVASVPRRSVTGNRFYYANNSVFGYASQPELADPSLGVDGKTESFSQRLVGADSVSGSFANVTSGSQSFSLGGSSGTGEISLDYTGTTRTKDPEVTIDAGGGSQTVSHNGILNQGEEVDLTNGVDTSLITGDVTVSATISDSVTGPNGLASVDYTHSGLDAGGTINYYLEDGAGNRSQRIPVDSITDVTGSINREKVKLVAKFIDGFSGVSADSFSVYLE